MLGVEGFRVYSSPSVDRIWDIWGSYYNIPKAIFYLLEGDYSGLRLCGPLTSESQCKPEQSGPSSQVLF